MHRYPLRLSRNYWRIPLYTLHQCSHECEADCPDHDCLISTVVKLSDYELEFPQTQDGPLYDPDLLVIPDLTFTVLITFPFTRPAEIPLSVSEPPRLDELLSYIKYIYMSIYDVEERTSTPTTFYVTNPCSCQNEPPAASSSVDPTSLDTSPSEVGEDNDVCSICHEELSQQVITTDCSHSFHKRCLTNWSKVKNTCPLCRVLLCSRCDADRNIITAQEHVVLPPELRSISEFRNSTNGIYGIHTCDVENIIITDLYYNRLTKTLQVHADTSICALLTINPWYVLLLSSYENN